jgi:hypothetical protein
MFSKSIKYLFKTRANNKDFDFSSFFPDTFPTPKQLLIEKCKKRRISIYINDPLEQPIGAYSIFRNPASEAELEHRFNAQKMIIFSENASTSAKLTYIIALLALIVSIITLVRSFL